MKEFDYVVTIKAGNFSAIDTVSRLMLILSLTVFVYSAVAKSDVAYAVIAFLLCAWFMYASFFNKRKYIIYYRLGFVIAAAGWFYGRDNYSWMGVVFMVAALLEKQVKFPQEIGVDEKGITFNTIPKKKHAWQQIENIVLKDGLITIDYKNNKLFQKETEREVSTELEKELNDFCLLRLNK